MNILITHFYTTDNNGDAAILKVIVEGLRTVFPESQLAVLSTQNAKSGELLLNIPQYQSFFYYCVYELSRVPRLIRSIYVVFVTVLWSVVLRFFGAKMNFMIPKPLRMTLQKYQEADLVIPVGGGYLTAKNNFSGNATVLLQLHAVLIAIILKKEIVLFSQSIGPFGNRLQAWLTSLILNRTAAIFVREDYSTETLRVAGVTKPYIARSADAAFLFDEENEYSPPNNLEERFNLQKPFAVITLRNWFKGEQQQFFERTLAAFAQSVAEQYNLQVLFVPQVTATIQHDDDREVIRRVKDLIKNQPNIHYLDGQYSAAELLSLYGKATYIIGMRMHSVIFALKKYVPAIAIAYEYKTSGVMADLNLSDWVIDSADATVDMLQSKFSQLINARESYIANLKVSIPKYKKLASVPFDYIRQNYG